MSSSLAQPIAILPGDGNQNSLHIVWMLHNACNHRCSYCDKTYWGGSERWLTLKGVQSFWRQIKAHYKRDHIHVSFTGGEPTLWPEFGDLCRMLKDEGCDLGMTSNGSHSMKVWQATLNCYNWLCLSYHPEHTKDDHFLKVIEMMAPQTRVAVRLMMHKEEKFWQRSIAFGEKIKTLSDGPPVWVEYVPLQDDFAGKSGQARPKPYEPWQNDFFGSRPDFSYGGKSEEIGLHLMGIRDVWDYQVTYSDGRQEFCRPNKLVASNMVNFQNWSCNAGLDLLFVNAEGEIFRGGCRVGGKIGHIFDEKIAFPGAPVVCPRTFCNCGSDIQVKKQAGDGMGIRLHD